MYAAQYGGPGRGHQNADMRSPAVPNWQNNLGVEHTMDGLPLDFTSRLGKAAAAAKASGQNYKRKKEDENGTAGPANVGEGGSLANAPLDFGQNEKEDEVFASIYTTQYGGPGRGRQEADPAPPSSQRRDDDDEEDIPHTEDGLPLDFTSRSGKAANLRAKAMERLHKKRQEEELRCKRCGEMGHFTQGCPTTLKGAKPGAGAPMVTGRLTFYNPKIRPRIIGTGGAVVQGLEKETGCRITLDTLPGDPSQGFSVRISGPTQDAVDAATRAINDIAASTDHPRGPGAIPMGAGMGVGGALAAGRGLWQGGAGDPSLGAGGYIPGMPPMGAGGHRGDYGALPGGGDADADITRTIAQQIAERRQAGGAAAPLGFGGMARSGEVGALGGREWDKPGGGAEGAGGGLPTLRELEDGLAEELRSLAAAQRQEEADAARRHAAALAEIEDGFATKRRRVQDSYAERKARVEQWMLSHAVQAQPYAQAYTPAQGQAYTQAQGQAYTQAQGQAYTQAQGQAYTQAQGQAYTQAQGQAYTQAQGVMPGGTHTGTWDASGFRQGEAQSYADGGSQGYRDGAALDAYAQGYGAAGAAAGYGTGVAATMPASGNAGHRPEEAAMYGHYNVGAGDASVASSYPATGYAGYGADASGYTGGGMGVGAEAYGQYGYGT